MYERFTDRARKAMQFANQEAQRLCHEYIGTEHILLGLLKEGSGVAAQVLTKMGVELSKARAETEKLIQAGPDMVTMGKLPQTPRSKKAVEYAMEEARDLKHNYVGTEHILLGLLREANGVAYQVLVNLGLKIEDVRTEIISMLSGQHISHDLFATTAEDVAKEFRESALRSAKELRAWVDHIISELQNCQHGAFSAGWTDELIKKTYAVVYEIGRANGAVLVRTKPKQMELFEEP